MDYLYFQELYHSGIKGMKWGYRRFTNPDGTLTEEGKQRYGYNESTGKMDATGKRQFKIDSRAIKGQRLYENGTSAVDVNKRRKATQFALAAGFLGSFAGASALAYKFSGGGAHMGTPKQKALVGGLLATTGTMWAGMVANNIIAGEQKKNLRAYSVNGPKKYHKITEDKK